jgi:hypothetical protein
MGPSSFEAAGPGAGFVTFSGSAAVSRSVDPVRAGAVRSQVAIDVSNGTEGEWQ